MTEHELTSHPLAKQFHALSPYDVVDAVEAGGRRCTGRFIVLNSYENRVYQLELDDETMVVGKFYRPGRWSKEEIEEEHAFLSELAEHDIPVAAPLELEEGETVGEVEGILYALFPRIGGREPQELNDEQVRVMGRLVARMHNVGSSGDAPLRKRLTPETYGRENLNYLVDNDVIPPGPKDNYVATTEALLDRIEPMFEGVPMHRIHGDCHLGNLIWTPEGPTFVDFDDLVIGPAVQDLWLIVASSDDEGERQRQILIEAYRTFRDFSDTWLRLIEPLRALRYINYATWIARRWEDPIFQKTFDQFGTERYWYDQVMDLREQIARIDTTVY